MEKSWYRLKKVFQGGEYVEWLFLSVRPSESFLEDWGDRTNGGHNYGYRVYVTKTTPPSHVVHHFLEEARKNVGYAKNKMEREEQYLDEIEKYCEKLPPPKKTCKTCSTNKRKMKDYIPSRCRDCKEQCNWNPEL